MEHGLGRGVAVGVRSVGATDAAHGFVTVERAGALAAGANGAGVLVAALDEDAAGTAAVRAILEHGDDLEAAIRVASAEYPGVRLLLADATRQVRLAEGAGAPPSPAGGDGAAIAVDGRRITVRLGPARTGVAIRHWPGVPVPEAAAWSGERPPSLAVDAERLDRLLESRPELQRAAADALDEARRTAAVEGEDAERQAGLMDAAGDVSGASVRRVLAVGYACEVAAAALTRLLGPAAGASL